MNLNCLITPSKEDKARCFVRLATHRWFNKRGIHLEKRLTYLQRKTIGFNFFKNDAEVVGAEIIDQITNLFDCEDGIYEVTICNVKRDWESGLVDDWDYVLSSVSNEIS